MQVLTKNHTVRSEPLRFGEATVAIEFIGPEHAADLLKLNSANRHPNQKVIGRYAVDMAAGDFCFNGDAVRIGHKDGDDVLIDGQQRLIACVRSKTGFWSLVVRGLDYDSVMPTIDGGRKRTLGDVLALRGVQNSVQVAAVSNLLWRLDHDRITDTSFRASTHQGLVWIDENPLVHDAVRVAKRVPSLETPIPVSTAGSAIVLGWRGAPDETDTFFSAFRSGEGLPTGSPVLVLRKWILRAASDRARPSANTYLAVTIKAMNAWFSGDSVGVLKWSPAMAFPEMKFPVSASDSD